VEAIKKRGTGEIAKQKVKEWRGWSAVHVEEKML